MDKGAIPSVDSKVNIVGVIGDKVEDEVTTIDDIDLIVNEGISSNTDTTPVLEVTRTGSNSNIQHINSPISITPPAELEPPQPIEPSKSDYTDDTTKITTSTTSTTSPPSINNNSSNTTTENETTTTPQVKLPTREITSYSPYSPIEISSPTTRHSATTASSNNSSNLNDNIRGSERSHLQPPEYSSSIRSPSLGIEKQESKWSEVDLDSSAASEVSSEQHNQVKSKGCCIVC